MRANLLSRTRGQLADAHRVELETEAGTITATVTMAEGVAEVCYSSWTPSSEAWLLIAQEVTGE